MARTTTITKTASARPRTKPVSTNTKAAAPITTKTKTSYPPPTTTSSSSPQTKSSSTKIPDMSPQLKMIETSTRTPYEKRVWTALCQIPPGHVSTYALLSAHLGSSPRAVGNALRRNPFAPQVPCHRVVATGGLLGGFKGKWPKDGEGITIEEKKKLLRGEGVRIDERGRVGGTPWNGFV